MKLLLSVNIICHTLSNFFSKGQNCRVFICVLFSMLLCLLYRSRLLLIYLLEIYFACCWSEWPYSINLHGLAYFVHYRDRKSLLNLICSTPIILILCRTGFVRVKNDAYVNAAFTVIVIDETYFSYLLLTVWLVRRGLFIMRENYAECPCVISLQYAITVPLYYDFGRMFYVFT